MSTPPHPTPNIANAPLYYIPRDWQFQMDGSVFICCSRNANTPTDLHPIRRAARFITASFTKPSASVSSGTSSKRRLPSLYNRVVRVRLPGNATTNSSNSSSIMKAAYLALPRTATCSKGGRRRRRSQKTRLSTQHYHRHQRRPPPAYDLPLGKSLTLGSDGVILGSSDSNSDTSSSTASAGKQQMMSGRLLLVDCLLEEGGRGGSETMLRTSTPPSYQHTGVRAVRVTVEPHEVGRRKIA